jgi:hypothetical protein
MIAFPLVLPMSLRFLYVGYDYPAPVEVQDLLIQAGGTLTYDKDTNLPMVHIEQTDEGLIIEATILLNSDTRYDQYCNSFYELLKRLTKDRKVLRCEAVKTTVVPEQTRWLNG